MTDSLRDQVYNNMSLKETDELIQIWQQHNTDEWTETAFEVVREILQDRLGELPLQDELHQDSEVEEIVDETAHTPETPSETTENAEFAPKGIVCPNCRGNHLVLRDVGIKYGAQKVVLKKPRTFFEPLIIEDDIVGIACEDCGFVFFMLKGYV